MEDLIVGEPENLFQPFKPLADGIGSVAIQRFQRILRRAQVDALTMAGICQPNMIYIPVDVGR